MYTTNRFSVFEDTNVEFAKVVQEHVIDSSLNLSMTPYSFSQISTSLKISSPLLISLDATRKRSKLM